LREENSQRLVIEQRLRIRSPRREFGKIVVARGYRAVWFIFRARWYDVGIFYDQNGRVTGYYSDIIRPVTRLLSSPSQTSIITDLFLDLWIHRDGRYVVLDEDQFDRAVKRRVISSSLARKTRREMNAIVRAINAGHFPPETVMRFDPKWEDVQV